MNVAAIAARKPVSTPKRKSRTSLPTTLEGFLRWKPEDGFKYEWNNGIIEKSTKIITPQQLYLVDNLTRFFENLKPVAGGRLVCEVQNRTSETQIRIPDIAYYTSEQIKKAAGGEYQPVTAFAIEIISDNDKFNHVRAKLKEYFQAGVQVVWLILPEFQEVYV